MRSHDYVSAFETRDDEQLQLDLDDTTKEAVLQAKNYEYFMEINYEFLEPIERILSNYSVFCSKPAYFL